MAAHHPQQGVVADRQHQPAGEPGRGAPAQGEAQMMDDVIEPGGPPCPGYQDLRGEAFGEDAPAAQHGVAVEAPGQDHQFDRVPRERKIRKVPAIAAVHPA